MSRLEPMLWGNFLHLYQPVTQKPYWIDRITTECYRPLSQGLRDNPNLKLTININSVLVEMLDREGHQDVIDNIKTVLERGQIELTGSAKYHPLLAFIPEYERIRQIKLNDKTHREYFGEAYQPRGFFPPEMAFTADIAATVADLGFEWLILDELSFPNQAQVDYHLRFCDAASGLGLYFRERAASWNILSGQIGTPALLEKMLADRLEDGSYLLTAMDGETFGHHRPGLQRLLFDLRETPQLKTCLISDLAKEFTEVKPVNPEPSTWALMKKDLERNAPFSRWNDNDNKIHTLQWQLTKMAIGAWRDKHQNSQDLTEDPLDIALQSDQYWWASARPWWSIENIERGAKNLYEAVCAAPDVSAKQKAQAKELYHKIVFTGFDWQRSGRVDAMAATEDEAVRQRTDSDIPELPQVEVDKMVASLQEELEQVVANQEYERAVQLRDRIEELNNYVSEDGQTNLSDSNHREWA